MGRPQWGGDVRAICLELAVRGPFIHQSRALMAAELAQSSYSFHFWEHFFLPFARYHEIAILNPAVLLRLDGLAAMVSKKYSQKWNERARTAPFLSPTRCSNQCGLEY